MQWPKYTTITCLLLFAAVLAASNLWFAMQRSAIPLAVSDRVVGKETRKEKHPGRDDVYLFRLESGGTLQVDRHVFESVQTGAMIRKDRWETKLFVAGGHAPLEWSDDVRGLALAMPAILLIFAATAWQLRPKEPSYVSPISSTEV